MPSDSTPPMQAMSFLLVIRFIARVAAAEPTGARGEHTDANQNVIACFQNRVVRPKSFGLWNHLQAQSSLQKRILFPTITKVPMYLNEPEPATIGWNDGLRGTRRVERNLSID